MRNARKKFRGLAALGLGDTAWRFYLSGLGNERGLAEDLVDVLLFQKSGHGFRDEVFLPPLGRCAGDYPLGFVQFPPGRSYSVFGLEEGEWCRHVLIVGMTGMGKTNLALHLLRQLGAKRKPYLVFDWKQSYRCLEGLPGFEGIRFITATGEDHLSFNPLVPPPGVDPGEWLVKLVDVLKHAYFVGEGVEYVLREAIDRVYGRLGFFESRAETPTFYLVRDYVHKKRLGGRMALWKASAMRVLEALCFRHGLGPVVNGDSIDHESTLSGRVVLELQGLSDSDKTFLVEAFILWLYEYRRSQPGKRGFRHALILEEAHHVLSRHKERAAGAETIMETCLRQIREFGEAVIVIDQEPSKLSASIRANTDTKIAFNLGHGSDILEIATDFGLDHETSQYIHLLGIGEAIVRVKSRQGGPCLVKFQKF